jgi:hypothetical protein
MFWTTLDEGVRNILNISMKGTPYLKGMLEFVGVVAFFCALLPFLAVQPHQAFTSTGARFDWRTP